MRVLQINSVCGIRSTGRIASDLAEALVKQGNECKVAYGRESVPDKCKDIAIRIGSKNTVKIHALRTRLFDNHCLASTKATREFIKWVKFYNPDIIHLHNLHGYYIDIRVLFSYLKQVDIPVVWTLHDCWAFTGHCAHFTVAGCNKWKCECYHCSQIHGYPQSWLLDRSKRNFNIKKEQFSNLSNMILVTPSEWLAGLVKKSFLGQYPVMTIHNSIDTSVFKETPSLFREKYGLINKIIVLGVASAWGEKKGLVDFIKLARMLDNKYKIVLVGLTREQMKRMPSNILCVERTNNTHELAEIYTAADYYVNLTYEDNYPTTNLEAQACGTPCITYRTGGSVESVPEENIVEQGDIIGVIDMLKRSLGIQKERGDMSWMISQYLIVYNKLMHKEKQE